jgi:hypothetical protein
MVPIVPEDNLLLTLPFGGAVLQSLGIPSEEVNVIMEEKRKELFNTRNLSNEESQMILFQLGIKDEEVEKQDFDKNSGQTSVAATDDAKPSMVKEVIEVMKKQQSLQTPELKAENSPEESEVK